MWPCSSQGREKDLPQKGHLQPAVWVLMCMLKAAGLLYSLLHTVQLWPGPALSGAAIIRLSWVTASCFTLTATDRSMGSLCSVMVLAGDQRLGLVCELLEELDELLEGEAGEERGREGEELSLVRGDTDPDLVWKAGLWRSEGGELACSSCSCLMAPAWGNWGKCAVTEYSGPDCMWNGTKGAGSAWCWNCWCMASTCNLQDIMASSGLYSQDSMLIRGLVVIKVVR